MADSRPEHSRLLDLAQTLGWIKPLSEGQPARGDEDRLHAELTANERRLLIDLLQATDCRSKGNEHPEVTLHIDETLESGEVSPEINRNPHDSSAAVFAKTLDDSAAGGSSSKALAKSQSGGSSEPQTNSSRYRVLRPLAQGGLGLVNVAMDEELGREVALKQILDEYAEEPTRRDRFVVEAITTGRLEHPGIVPVYGLGRDSNGKLFYAMRLIRGQTFRQAVDQLLDDSADGKDVGLKATIEEQEKTEQVSSADTTIASQSQSQEGPARNAVSPRFDSIGFRKILGRFVDVCDALEYAHQHGIIHRDLKPENIMLGDYGETLVVDWGIAKALGSQARASEQSSVSFDDSSNSSSDFTQAGSVVGTPAYMPPEQAAGRSAQVGVTSDVFGLGGVLYYALTGRAPFCGASLREVLEHARNGEVQAAGNIHKIPASLQAIVMKALATQPSDRYLSARALADDIDRYLADEPLPGVRESISVRTRRWVRKHPGLFASLSVTVVVGLLFSITLAWIVGSKNRELAVSNFSLDQANRQLNEKNQALVEANLAEQAALEAAKTERDRALSAEQIAKQSDEEARAYGRFLTEDVLSAARPEGESGGLGIDVKLKPAILAAIDRIDQRFFEKPLAEALTRHSLGVTFRLLGDLEISERELRKAWTLRKQHLGENDRATLESQNSLAVVLGEMGRLQDSMEMHQDILERRSSSYPDDLAEILFARGAVALAAKQSGDIDRGIKEMREVLKGQEELFGKDSPQIILTLMNLATALMEKMEFDEAETLFLRALALQEESGDQRIFNLITVNNLANAYSKSGDLQRALELLERIYFIATEQLGEGHPTRLAIANNYAATFRAQGDLDEAIEIYIAILPLLEATFGETNFKTLGTKNNLAVAYQKNGELDKAIPLMTEVQEGMVEQLGAAHRNSQIVTSNLVSALREVGRDSEAEALVEQFQKLLDDRENSPR